MDFKKDDWVTIIDDRMIGDSWLGTVMRVDSINIDQTYPIACIGPCNQQMPVESDEIRHATAVEILEARLKYGI